MRVDPHEQAAALLSGSRISRQAQQEAQQATAGAATSARTF
jgi:hypothetical protein